MGEKQLNQAQALKVLAVLLACFPPVYVFVAIQYGALTVPYWDHVDLIRLIESVKVGGFSFEQLWAPHNHSRPLFYRLIYLPNALATGWDIRSEYVFMYLAIYAGFLLHAWILFQNTSRRMDVGFSVGLALLSLVYFSPVGHMNHWWSMLLQLQLGNVFILLALWAVSNRPSSWMANVVAAVACWVATYTITNGIFAFAICAGVVFVSTELRHNWARIGFWVANIVLMLAAYLPGLPDEAGGNFSIVEFVGFIAVYLGLPLGGLLQFEYVGPFTHPAGIGLNALCGILLSAIALYVLYSRREEARAMPAAYRFLLACVGFAMMSAVVTAEGRSYSGAVYANSSRYVIYSGFLLLGLLHYGAATLGRNASVLRREAYRSRHHLHLLGAGALSTLLVAFSLHAYWKGVAVYKGAHDFNEQLVAVYVNPSATDEDVAKTYPDVAFARRLRELMLQYSLGPYRFQSRESVSLIGAAPFSEAIRLEDGIVVRQRFTASRNGFKGLSLQFVTWQTQAPEARLGWAVSRIGENGRTTVANGRLNMGQLTDWGYAHLDFEAIGDSSGEEYELQLMAPKQPLGNELIGLPVFSTPEDGRLMVMPGDGSERKVAGSLGIMMIYGD